MGDSKVNEIVIDERNSQTIIALNTQVRQIMFQMELVKETILNCQGITDYQSYALSPDMTKIIKVQGKEDK